MDLQQLHNDLKKVDLVGISYQIFEELETFIADLNRDQLAGKGVNSDNVDLGVYRPFTIEMKEKKSGISGIVDHVTLFDTGAFHKSILSTVINDSLILDATDGKLSELESVWGSNILGLTETSIKILQAKYFELFEKRLNELLPIN